MPVEIRELIIKTEIKSTEHYIQQGISAEELQLLKAQVLEDCKKMIQDLNRKTNYKR